MVRRCGGAARLSLAELLLAMDSAAHKDNKDELPVALKSYAELVFSVPHETALVEFIFSIMDVVQAGRRTSTSVSAVANAVHLRAVPPVLGCEACRFAHRPSNAPRAPGGG